jgi:uncharacterized membrane protein
VFLASLVEAVEALTIVLAAGIGRDWKSAQRGTLLAMATLVVVIASLGPLLTQVPVNLLHLIVGLLSLVFGLQWLRKAILRSSGFKALHDEELIFEKELAELKKAESKKTFVGDWYAFTLSYKAVLLEGIEVAFIVLSFGAIQGKIVVASLTGLAAVLVVVLAGVFLRKPLTKVPENAMKFIVGLVISTFGVFWVTQGTGVYWTESDLSLIPIFLSFAVFSVIAVYFFKARHAKYVGQGKTISTKLAKTPKLNFVVQFIYDFLVGDDWPTALFLYAALVVSYLLQNVNSLIQWLILAVVLAVTSFRITRITQN